MNKHARGWKYYQPRPLTIGELILCGGIITEVKINK